MNERPNNEPAADTGEHEKPSPVQPSESAADAGRYEIPVQPQGNAAGSFRVGDRVECVDADGLHGLMQGKSYRVRCFGWGGWHIMLLDQRDLWYPANRFKPIAEQPAEPTFTAEDAIQLERANAEGKGILKVAPKDLPVGNPAMFTLKEQPAEPATISAEATKELLEWKKLQSEMLTADELDEAFKNLRDTGKTKGDEPAEPAPPVEERRKLAEEIERSIWESMSDRERRVSGIAAILARHESAANAELKANLDAAERDVSQGQLHSHDDVKREMIGEPKQPFWYGHFRGRTGGTRWKKLSLERKRHFAKMDELVSKENLKLYDENVQLQANLATERKRSEGLRALLINECREAAAGYKRGEEQAKQKGLDMEALKWRHCAGACKVVERRISRVLAEPKEGDNA